MIQKSSLIQYPLSVSLALTRHTVPRMLLVWRGRCALPVHDDAVGDALRVHFVRRFARHLDHVRAAILIATELYTFYREAPHKGTMRG